MTFEDFASSDARLRNGWVREEGISIYVRKPTGFTHNADFELASMEADEPGNGALTAFLSKKEQSYTFYIENILNERLAGFFKRRGYRVVTGFGGALDLCMISSSCWHMRDR